MNLVGKIFVVLTLVLSLVLMSLTVVVYMTQVNWMRMANNTDPQNGYPLGLIQQLENCQKENQELRNAYAILVGTYEVALQKSTNAAKEVDVVKNSQVEEISKRVQAAHMETSSKQGLIEEYLAKPLPAIRVTMRMTTTGASTCKRCA